MSIYPKMKEVEKADRVQICRWFRFLPSPTTEEEARINDRVFERYVTLDGMTPQISKQIGWDDPYS